MLWRYAVYSGVWTQFSAPYVGALWPMSRSDHAAVLFQYNVNAATYAVLQAYATALPALTAQMQAVPSSSFQV